MAEEGNETCNLCYCTCTVTEAASGGAQGADSNTSPASGGEWFIKNGNVLNLAEMCWWARGRLSVFEFYKMYICLPIYCHKKKHSESQSPAAVFRRNAKQLKYNETGYYGLNSKWDK